MLALVGIVVGVSGVEVPLPRLGGAGSQGAQQLVPGVRAVASTLLLRAPAGGDLAFLALEPSGNLVVTDRARKTILRFDAAGHLLTEWGPRLGDLTIGEPAGVAVLGDAFYVVDRNTQRVLRLDAAGRLQSSFSLEQFGPYGLNGLALDPYGLLYVADTGRNRVLVFTPDGNPVKQFGRGGSGLGDFTQPMTVAFSVDGTFAVADWENGRLERFDPGNAPLNDFSLGFRPFGVAADPAGRLYAPDNEKRRVVAYTTRGDVLGELGGPGSVPIDVAPRQLAFGASGLYVLGGDGIVRLDLEDTAAPPQGGSDVDVVGPLLFAMLLGVPVLAVLMRRGRVRGGSVAAAANRPVGLHAENGAQGQQQQPRANQQLLIADQTEREQNARDKDHQAVGDRKSSHQRSS